MKSKFISLIVCVAVVLGLMLVPAVATNVVTADTVCGIEVVPSLAKVGYNQAFDVNISITDTVAQDMAAWTVYMTFNNTLMNVTGITPCAMLPTGKAPDDVPGYPKWDNATGIIDHQSGTKVGDPYANSSFVVMTVHFLSSAVQGTGSLNFIVIDPTMQTSILDPDANSALDWSKVVNGTVKVGQATLVVTVGQDLAYNVTYPGPGQANGTQYRILVGASPPNAFAEANWCPMLDRMSMGIPIKLQSADLVVDIASGDMVQQTVHLLANLGAGYVPTTIVRTFVYVGAHGKPYSVGKNWSYNVFMYLPDLGTWVNSTSYANVVGVDMIPCEVNCGVPVVVPAWHIVITDAPVGGNITEEDWYSDYIGTGAMVKMVDYATYALIETSVLSGTTGPYGDVNIGGVGIPASYPNVTKWDWNTVVNLTAVNSVAGWTFSHWNGDLVCSSANPTNITMSDDKTVVATFCELPPQLTYLGPASLTFTCRTGGLNPDDQVLEIKNGGGGTLAWSASDDAAWLSETPINGTLTAGVHQNINVSVDNSGLGVGTYLANVTLSGSPAVVVPVTLIVTPATSIDVMRDLPGNAMELNQTYPGDTFNVTVTFTAPVDNFNSIGLTDLAPAGWTVAVNKSWCSPVADEVTNHGNKVEIAWYGPYSSGTNFSATYKVTVPATATPGINLFPNCDIAKAWCEYYFGEDGPYGSCVKDEYQILITVPGEVVGETRDVNAGLLPDVKVTLERGVAAIDSDESTPDYSITCWNTGNDYWLSGAKNRYFTLDTDVIGGIAGHNINHTQYMDLSTAALLVGGYTLDFEGDYGLVPMTCTMSYAMKSVNLWLFWPAANNEWGLSIWKAMESVNSWQNPS